jgi:hypothetical protein
MKRTYSCPHCEAVLNPDIKIILRVEKGGKKGLILFSPRPGDYHAILPSDPALETGDRVSFACPVCSKDLRSSRGEEWAEIQFHSTGRIEGTAHFSTVFGRHATCFVTQEEEHWYGEDVQETMHFWASGPMQED